MKPLLLGALLALALLCTSCEKWLMPPDIAPTPSNTFNYLWQQVDRQYALFDVKAVDWDSVYRHYAPQVSHDMPPDSLFALMAAMLNSLNDGHVNLMGNHNTASSVELFLRRYGSYNIDLPTIALHYLGPYHHTDGGLQYAALDSGHIVYARYSSFANSLSTARLQAMVQRYPNARGLIVDLRQNGGGSIDNLWQLLRFFPSHGQLLYTTQMKNGPQHHCFTTPTAVYAPQPIATPYDKPTVMLIDRGSYSATSFCALCAKQYANITLVGDTTGGGLGLPNGGSLPNGWHYRLSVTRTLDPHGVNYENGVPPHIVCHLRADAVAQGHDNVVDTAVALINACYQ